MEDAIAKIPPCPPRREIVFSKSPEVTAMIDSMARVAPLYESGLYQHNFRKHYSFLSNEFLQCQWDKYKNRLGQKKTEPFQFPNDRDMHFHNCMIRFLPSETNYKRPCFRKSLKPGPGVDYGGQMVIPQELHMKRLSGEKKEISKKKIKGKNVRFK